MSQHRARTRTLGLRSTAAENSVAKTKVILPRGVREPDARDLRIQALYANSQSCAAVARELGVSPKAVELAVQRLKVWDAFQRDGAAHVVQAAERRA
jgi:hypothetical protein